MELLNTISVLSIFQLLLLIVLLFSKSGKILIQYKFFVAFLKVNLLIILLWLLYNNGYLKKPGGTFALHIALSSFFLLGPIIYLYFKLTFHTNKIIDKSALFHLTPIFIYTLYFTLVKPFLFPTINTEQIYPMNFSEHVVYSSAAYFHLAAYVLLSFMKLKEYKAGLYNQTSNIDNKTIAWMNSLIIIYALHWLFEVFCVINNTTGIAPARLSVISIIISTAFLLVFATITVIQRMNGFALITFEENKTKYANSNLTSKEKEVIKTQILKCLEVEKIHLEPEVTLSTFSEKLAVPVKSISQVINESFKCNFFDFINSFRIEETKTKMLSDKNGSRHKTISEIMYDSGFNSKSAFNRAFKKHTGVTPTVFKKEYQEKV